MNWFPGFSWFVRPSGGPVKPGTRWWRTLYDAPLIAHPAGAWGIVGYEVLGWWLGGHDLGFMVWWNVLLGEAINQWHKATRGVYGHRRWVNVTWRMLLSAVSTLPAWWWL